MMEHIPVMKDIPAVRMHRISKRFPGVIANDGINFEARRGELHALLGENGAGKTTLMNILSGLYRPDSGEIYIYGKKVHLRTPRDAIRHEIGMVHQQFMLVSSHTVTENIMLGNPGGFFLPFSQVETKIRDLSEKYRLKIDPEARIWQLSVGEQQRVEIVKLLYRGADILILDEPTSVLTPQETEELFRTLRTMTAEGHCVIFISHKLEEVMAISDRITVLRGGKVVATVLTGETNPRALSEMMVGREVLSRVDKKTLSPGEVILLVENISALNDRGLPALKKVSFSLRERQILGIAGVAGNGQRELAEVIVRLRPVTSGKIFIRGKEITRASPREIIDLGVSYIPEDRLGTGLVARLRIIENTILKIYRNSQFTRGPFLNYKAIQQHARNLINQFAVATPGLDTPVKFLSGGNLQKVLLAREISSQPALMIALYPTRGLDVSATEMVRKAILQQQENGCAVILISEDLDEILSLSDLVAVLYEGQMMGIFPVGEARLEELGLLMAGKEVKVN